MYCQSFPTTCFHFQNGAQNELSFPKCFLIQNVLLFSKYERFRGCKNVALTNAFKHRYLVHFRLVYGKVYFHPPGQFLALNGRMGYKIRPGEPIKSRKKFKGIAITKT